MDISVVVGALLGLVALVLCYLVVRRLRLLRSGGVHVALRTRMDEPGKGWHLGVGRYHGDEFAWFRVLSLRAGPDRVIRRTGVEIADRRDPDSAEAYTMPAGARVIRFRHRKAGAQPDVEIAMGPDALTGFLSWLESAPPGRLPWAS
ncbi:DUF2550 domain-containing protein [Actinophytocola sp.]|uniref:DUF2550 domain-containing protein n=1 Tax=Actinophytocola sp. TaxID=1872138 RepID=UPI002D7E5F1E|nr:DUF2550 domain-containing protein [Actinophytocola sp.]HET9139092.1 DUF2550 domain-containing protein [Actinophytocola sp.]HEU5108532.1 DUF2550 domain-containing protein [Micromonosporaceae bacterium]